jgi:pre-mRNA-splicing factor SYF1
LIEYTFKDIKDKEMNENEENNKDENEEKFGFKKSDEIDLRFFRLENLIQRRPFLLSNTVLRQNPNNVYEWLNRIKLCEDDPYMAIKTYTEAITSVDPSEAFGKPSKIWINFG